MPALLIPEWIQIREALRARLAVKLAEYRDWEDAFNEGIDMPQVANPFHDQFLQTRTALNIVLAHCDDGEGLGIDEDEIPEELKP